MAASRFSASASPPPFAGAGSAAASLLAVLSFAAKPLWSAAYSAAFPLSLYSGTGIDRVKQARVVEFHYGKADKRAG
jgi:hypothetical protein